MEQNEEAIRLQKLEKIKSMGMEAYTAKFDKKQTLAECFDSKDGKKIKTAGRLVMFRDMGKLTFAHLQDFSGRMQIAFKQDDLGKETLNKVCQIED